MQRRGAGRFAAFAGVVLLSGCVLADQPCPLLPVAGEGPAGGVLSLQFDPELYALAGRTVASTFEGMMLPDGSFVDLAVTRFEIFTDDAVFVHAGPTGEVRMPRPDVQLWRGEVVNKPDSRVFLALTPHGSSGYIMSGGTTFVIATVDGKTVIHDAAAMPAAPDGGPQPVCAGAVTIPGDVPPPANTGTTYAPRVYTCRNYRLAVDCDYEFTQNRFGGNQTNSQAYATSLLGAVSEIYSRDMNVTLSVPYLRTWGSNDPYTAANTGDQLPEFRSYWQNNMGSVQRNLAHLLSGRSLGGGIAYLRGACSLSTGYAVSANLGGSFPYPLRDRDSRNWDPMVVAHELGHNLGTGHTHDLNYYNPIIDGCGSNPQDCSQATQGTIMSYCHTCSGGMSNINLTFGPRVITVIRNYLDGSASLCGTQTSQTSVTQQPANASVLAGQNAAFSVATSGAAPTGYQWQRDGENLVNGGRISGATTPTLTVSSVQAGDVGDYRCVLTTGCGPLTTDVGALSIITCPGIISQPTDVSAALLADISLTALANGSTPRTYQWRRNGSPISNNANYSGVANYRLFINNLTVELAGTYDVVVTNPCGSTTSNPAVVSVATGNCGSADFDADGDAGTDSDIEAFFACLGGNCCPACGSADFDGDGDSGTDADIEAFFRVLGGGAC